MNSDLNLNFVAIGVAVFLGAAVMLWSAALKRVSGGEFFVILGLAYCLAGLIKFRISGDKFVTSGPAITITILCAVVYVCALIGFNYMYARAEGPQVATVTAISATYPAIVAILVAVTSSKMLTWREILFLVIAVIGVVGLSLSGKR